ncbi:MAG: hypothetical protein ACM3ZC_01255 [Bacteroidota bacterium]
MNLTQAQIDRLVAWERCKGRLRRLGGSLLESLCFAIAIYYWGVLALVVCLLAVVFSPVLAVEWLGKRLKARASVCRPQIVKSVNGGITHES